MLNQYRQSSYNYKISTWEILAAVHLAGVQLNINESVIACMYLYIQPGCVWMVWMLICSCGDQVLAVDYRWLAGFWISFLWYPLNVFTPFEVMSVLKYLSPFMFNHGCLRLRNFFFRGRQWKQHNSIHQIAKKSLGKVLHITKHDLLKHNMRLLLCLRWVIRVQRRVKELNDRRILTELAHLLCHWIWSTDCVFCSSNELYSMCVMCQELIRMLDELANCSQCTFPQSHGSSDLDSFSLYFTSLYRPVLLPGCMWGILHCWNWFS